jgi:hypothetical protein
VRASRAMSSSVGRSAIDLCWLPLGAGGHSVRLNGRIFEWVAARIEHRDRCDLYHSALEVRARQGRFVIEQAPAWSEGGERGVVAVGSVGTRAAGRFRLFRYEIRRWRDGLSRTSPRRSKARVGSVTTPTVLGGYSSLCPRCRRRSGSRRTPHRRDVDSNSLISWLIARSGLEVDSVARPTGGRAPGWRAGIVVAHREQAIAAPATTAGSG